jgi:hypothetical protein
MQRDPMPWSFKAALVGFGIFAIGAALIVCAHFQGRWEAILFSCIRTFDCESGIIPGIALFRYLRGDSSRMA